jgi:(p)ppGpp synthase/HD superfamily hydrolase
MMSTLDRAIEIAARDHRGQTDKVGRAYILHPLRLMLRMETELEMTVAVLHDVVEDTATTLDDLRREGFSEEVVLVVEHLTHRDGENYDEYIERVGRNPAARRVKLADLEDNMNLLRIRNLQPNDLERLQRYHRAWLQLSDRA